VLNLWTSLNTPQAIVICIALIGLLFGLGPVAIQCATHIIESVLCAILAAIAAVWPAFGKSSAALVEALRRQWKLMALRRPPRFRQHTPEELMQWNPGGDPQ
jgi:hypothetical protein